MINNLVKSFKKLVAGNNAQVSTNSASNTVSDTQVSDSQNDDSNAGHSCACGNSGCGCQHQSD